MNEDYFRNSDYGKNIENPILLKSINATLHFLSSLVKKENGFHFIAHRLGSQVSTKSVVDVYELYCTDGSKDNLYFSIYSDKNYIYPPEGYLFENGIDIIGFDISEEFIYKTTDEDFKDNTKNKVPLLEQFIFSSKANNFRFFNFPEEMIKDLYNKGELFLVNDLDELLESLRNK
jgi:hypothetical protein